MRPPLAASGALARGVAVGFWLSLGVGWAVWSAAWRWWLVCGLLAGGAAGCSLCLWLGFVCGVVGWFVAFWSSLFALAEGRALSPSAVGLRAGRGLVGGSRLGGRLVARRVAAPAPPVAFSCGGGGVFFFVG